MNRFLRWSLAGVLLLGVTASFVSAADDIESLEEQAIRAAAERVAPSVLKIETVGGLEKIGSFLVGTGPTTGLVVDSDGYIISSAFNFVQKPASILVTLPNGAKAAAQLVATDHSRMLVLLKVKTDKPLAVPDPAPLADLAVGQWAIALGRTYDGSKPSISAGIISALNRIWGKAIQTDAKISPANYGGPLVDIRGRVLGVLVPLSPQASDEMAGVEWYDSGIGFAIPLEQINAALPRLKKGEDLYPGLLGVSLKGKDIYADAAQVAAVQPNSPAYKAGLKPDDAIVELNGKPIATQAQLRQALAPHYAGETVKLVVARGADKLTKEIELIAKVVPYRTPFLGILPARDPPSKDAPGVVVRTVLSKSPATAAGLKPEDRLTAVNGKPIASRDALVEQLAAAEPGSKVKLDYVRGSEKKQAEITVGTSPDEIPATLPIARAARPAYAGDRPDVGLMHIKIPDAANECTAFVPENYDPEVAYGVVIWLNPPGATVSDETLDRWKKACTEQDLILLMPKPVDPQRWEKTETAVVRKAFDEIQRTFHVDPNRVVAHGQEAGAGMAFLLAFANRDAIRAVAVVDGSLPPGVAPPANEPVFPLAFYSAATSKAIAAAPIMATITQLRADQYPVTVRPIKEGQKYLSDVEFAEFLRWVDSLDRI
ncbi:MAG TPA: PDZ domain-containing protein [Pirellulales bacterium]|jgi:serine protease Do|nr:PDZ domain-containing protein [Pirellulales bacterium]